MMKPDFLIIPYEIHACEDLRQCDSVVYAVAYWFEKMKDGKCIASNATLAEIANVSERSIGGSLERLENNGFIKRIFRRNGKDIKRVEIKTLVAYTKKENKEEEENKEEDKVDGKIAVLDKKETPGEKAKRFFAPDGIHAKEVIATIVEKSGGNINEITAEVRKFYSYWTEPNKSGTKVRWQMERTFDVERRLITWFSNKRIGFKKAGSGRVI